MQLRVLRINVQLSKVMMHKEVDWMSCQWKDNCFVEIIFISKYTFECHIESQGSKRSFYEHHYTWFILEQLLSRSVRIILLSVISKNEKFDKSIVWWFQSNRRSSKVISVLIWIYIFRPKWQSPRILRNIIRFHIFKFLCLVSLYIFKVGALLMLEYPIN